VKRKAVQGPPDLAELMEVTLPLVGPADKFDPKLVGRVGGAKIIGLIEPELVIELKERRDRALAYANGTDRFGFDQYDATAIAADETRQRCRRHPAGRSAADDHDTPDRRALAHARAQGRFAPNLTSQTTQERFGARWTHLAARKSR